MDAFDVFFDELMKSAAASGVLARRAARWLTESPARTALVSGAAGAAGGAAMHGKDESAVEGALRGGLRGALVGGSAAGLGRAYRDTKLLKPGTTTSEAIKGTAARMGEGVQRFMKRQAHGLTGAYADQAGAIGMRSSQEAERRIDLLRRRGLDRFTRDGAANYSSTDQLKKIKDLREWGRGGDEALHAGVTSIPGVAKGLAKHPAQTGKALVKQMAGGAGRGGAAVALGLPLAFAGPDLARGDESQRGGRSMREKLVGVGSGMAGGVLTAGMPIVPQLVAGGALDAATSRLARRKPQPMQAGAA